MNVSAHKYRRFVGGVILALVISATVPTASKGQQPADLLRDLPPPIYEFVVHRHLLATLARAQIELIKSMLIDKGIAANEKIELSAVKLESIEALNILHMDDPVDSPRANLAPPALSGREIRAVYFVNLRESALWISERYRDFETEICDRLPIPSELTDKRAERHNFLIFYIRTVQELCGAPFDWRPNFQDIQHQPLYEVFSRNTGPISRDLWFANLHQYLETPSNLPFMRRPKAYIAVYAQYAELSFEARHVSLANREFLVRRSDLYSRFLEIEILQGLFAALIARGIVG